MKTLKSLTVAICLLAACTIAKANIKEDKLASPNFAINTYVNAVSYGNLTDFDKVVDNTAKFNMVRGDSMLSFDKTQVKSFYKQCKGIVQDCKITTSIVSTDASVTVVKVDMQYDNFTRSNFVTLSHTDNSWKITNVYTVFK